MGEEIHIHVPKGAKVIIHEDEPEVEREATLDDVLKELRELHKLEAERFTVVPYLPAPIWIVPYQPMTIPASPPLPRWHINSPYTVTCDTNAISTQDTVWTAGVSASFSQ